MRKTILSLALAIVAFSANSQKTDKDDYKISIDYVHAKMAMPAAIKRLEESDKIFVEYPPVFTYYKGAPSMDLIGYRNIERLDIKAKRVKKVEEANYTFRITTPGMKITPAAPEFYSEDRPAAYLKPAVHLQGYVYKFRFYMPITVDVVNKEGSVEKSFRFNADSGTWIYHSNFLLDHSTTEDWNPEKAVLPFATETAALDHFKKNESAVYTRMEYNTWYNTMSKVRVILEKAYADGEMPKVSLWSKTLTKKSAAEFPKIDEAVKKLFDAVKLIREEKKATEGKALLGEVATSFDALVLDQGDYTDNIRRVILSNAIWAALLTGHLNKAAAYYKSYSYFEKNDKIMLEGLTPVYAYFYERSSLSKDSQVITPNSNVSILIP